MQSMDQELSVGAGLGAVVVTGAALACWRLFYPVSDAALLLLLVLALLIWRGTFLRVFARRTIWRKAIWRPGSVMAWLLTGRFGAHVAGLCAAVIAVPTLGHYALGASELELGIAAGILAVTAVLLLWVGEGLTSQLRGPLALPLATPPIFMSVGAAGTALLFWASYTLIPAPDYLAASSMADTIAQAQSSLPPRDHPAAQVLAGMRSFEAASWRLAQAELNFAGTKFGLIFLLAYNAMVAFSLARLACDAVAAAAQTLPEAS